MKLIYKQTEKAKQLLGEQDIKSNEKYRPFKYVIDTRVEDGVLLYHTLTFELIFLSFEEYENYRNRNECNKETIEYLIKHYYMVPNSFDDKSFMNQLLDSLALINNIYLAPKLNSLIIFTTSDCNARCFYCFEKGTRKVTMTEKTAHDVADFIERKCSNPINIRWFGGEPLYNSKAIDIISEDLNKKNIKLVSTMVTNGYLFDEETISKAKNKWNLKKVQITLDGTEKIYNRIKNYIYNDNSSPFIRVLENIENLLKADIAVNIRLNMDTHNQEDLFDLSKLLVKRFSKYEKCGIYVKLLYEDTCDAIQFREAEKRHRLMQKSFELQDYISSNMSTALPKNLPSARRTNYCMSDNDAAAMIFSDGNLGRCEHYTEDDFYGSIYSDKVDMNNILYHKQLIKIVPECDDCEYRNVCRRPKCCNSGHALRCDDFDKIFTKKRFAEKMTNIYNIFKANESKKSE